MEDQKQAKPMENQPTPQNGPQRHFNNRSDRGERKAFPPRPGNRNNDARKPMRSRGKDPRKPFKKARRTREDEMNDMESRVIEVRRVTRVVKGGKRMRFSALVVVGDRQGRVGFGLKKGIDYQESVAKATKKARNSLIKITLNEDGTLEYPLVSKHKSCMIMLKPAKSGTGLIAGGFLRPVLELAGVQNIYSKVIRSRNKIAGIQAAIKALESYQVKNPTQ